MRYGEKTGMINQSENQLFGVDFHDFIQKEQDNHSFEIASEFGLTLGEVRKLKRRMNRS